MTVTLDPEAIPVWAWVVGAVGVHLLCGIFCGRSAYRAVMSNLPEGDPGRVLGPVLAVLGGPLSFFFWLLYKSVTVGNKEEKS